MCKLKTEVFGLVFDSPIGIIQDQGSKTINANHYSWIEIAPIEFNSIKVHEEDKKAGILISSNHILAFRRAYDFYDFFIINIQSGYNFDYLDTILEDRVLEDSYKPIILNLSDNINDDELKQIVEYSLLNRIDGIQTSNEGILSKIHQLSSAKLPIIAISNSSLQSLKFLDKGASLIVIRSNSVKTSNKLANELEKALLNRLCQQVSNTE